MKCGLEPFGPQRAMLLPACKPVRWPVGPNGNQVPEVVQGGQKAALSVSARPAELSALTSTGL